MALRVVGLVEVHAERDGHVGVLRRRRDDHLARARGEVLAGALAGAEAPARLDHHVDAEVAPGQVRGIGLGEDRDLAAVDPQLRVVGLDLAGKRPNTESWRSRCASVSASMRSLIATTSMSASRS